MYQLPGEDTTQPGHMGTWSGSKPTRKVHGPNGVNNIVKVSVKNDVKKGVKKGVGRR